MLISYIFLDIDVSNIFKFNSDSPRHFTLFASKRMGWEENWIFIFSQLLCDFKNWGIFFPKSLNERDVIMLMTLIFKYSLLFNFQFFSGFIDV